MGFYVTDQNNAELNCGVEGKRHMVFKCKASICVQPPSRSEKLETNIFRLNEEDL